MTVTVTLDCGHAPSPHSPSATGTAHTSDNREICWDCADNELRQQLADLTEDDAITLYLSSDGHRVESWSGGRIAGVLFLSESRQITPSGGRYTRAHAQIIGNDGRRYVGRGPGRGMYMRVRVVKGQ